MGNPRVYYKMFLERFLYLYFYNDYDDVKSIKDMEEV